MQFQIPLLLQNPFAAPARITMASETDSIFSYDGEGESDTFSLSLLTAAVTEYFQTTCRLVKLAQGGFHKVSELNPIESM